MKQTVLSLSLILLAFGATAQRPMTLKECIRIALSDSKELQMADTKIAEAHETTLSIRGHFLPQVNGSGIAGWNSSNGTLLDLPKFNVDIPLTSSSIPIDFPGYDIDYRVGGIYYAGITVQQPIYMGGRIASGYRMAQIGENVAQERRELTESEVVYQTCQAYFLLLKAQRLDSVATTALTAADEMMRAVCAAGEYGMAQRTDMKKVELARGELQLSALQAKNGVRLAQRNLCVQMGVRTENIVAISVPYGFFLQNEIPAVSVADRPEYRMLDAQVDLYREKLTTARSEMLPQVGLQGGYGYLYGLHVSDNIIFDGGSVTLLASIKIPLWQSGVARHNMEAAKVALHHSELERSLMADRMALEQLQAQNLYDEAQLKHDLSIFSLSLAEDSLTLTQKQYKVGQTTLADLLRVQAQLQKKQEEVVEAMCDVYLARLRLMKAAGRLMEAFDVDSM